MILRNSQFPGDRIGFDDWTKRDCPRIINRLPTFSMKPSFSFRVGWESPSVAVVAEEAAESDMRSLLPIVVALSTAHRTFLTLGDDDDDGDAKMGDVAIFPGEEKP